MTHELCILFAYHKLDEVTIRHFTLLKHHNPRHHIIPITDDISEHLPGTIDVKVFDDPWAKTSPWRRCDTMLYRWFLNRPISAKRYLLLEYDCLCTIDVEIAYADVWDAEVASRDLFFPGQNRDCRLGKYVDREWTRFEEIGRLPPGDRQYAAGLAPLVGTIFSHNGLQSIVETVVRNDVFCELRMGTAARKAGLKIAEFPASLKRTIQWDPNLIYPERPGIYHSVKWLDYPRRIHVPDLSRNSPCPCDSGKRYKDCHGALL
jgi:hypothetical protein